jgi:DNA helicase HerA-like ATPase
VILLGRDSEAGPTARLGTCVARDGSDAAPVRVDVDRAHAGVVVGKRGYGKSYTLGVLAESLAGPRTCAVVVDPMGTFGSLAAETDGASRAAPPTVPADAVPPRAWPRLLGLDPTGGAGALVWRAAAERATLPGMRSFVADADASGPARRAAANHLELAASWDVFDPDGLTPAALLAAPLTVLDCSGLAAAPTNAVVRAVARGLYEARVAGTGDRLPWLLVDEAHVVLGDGAVARPALETVLTRGRAPGVSLVAATQRPAALPEVAVSQADLLVAHRLTAEPDRDALRRARPSYVTESLTGRLPRDPGEALVVDDATEAVHLVRVRERATTHDGDGTRATALDADGDPADGPRP